MALALRRRERPAGDDVPALVAQHAERLPPLADDEFGRLFDRYGDARVVLIGEATHGTSEFYRARASITRHLIEHHGFSIVALEADWPDVAQIDRHVRQRPRPRGPARPAEPAFSRFPTWMWRNAEVQEFLVWLREYNAERPAAQRAEIRGLDVYSLRASMAAVLRYLDERDPAAAAQARERYGCLMPWQSDPARYGQRVMLGAAGCEGEVLAQLRTLLDRRLARLGRDGEDFFDAAQNARVVKAAEEYYRVLYQGSRESWNLRDRHMFETLDRLLERRGPDAKAVVWAHNSHVGDAAATAMGWSGELNIGELCRKAWGRAAVLIGQGTDRGSVAAADDWDGPMRIKTVQPSRENSWERLFLDAGVRRSLTDWRSRRNGELVQALSQARLERAIGVIYRPETELASHYFEAMLAVQFDAWLWFEATRAVTARGIPPVPGAAETYPFGV